MSEPPPIRILSVEDHPVFREGLSTIIGTQPVIMLTTTDGDGEIQRAMRAGAAAYQLSIAEGTVNFHIKNLVDKLGANDRAHALTIAFRRGLLQI